jgi:predicted HicB family RNase H-like nuclease
MVMSPQEPEPKTFFALRIDPRIKEAAKKAAKQARLTFSKYVENLIRLDLWRKRLFG